MNCNIIRIGTALLLALGTTVHAGVWQAGILAENSQSPFIDSQRDTSPVPMVNYVGERFGFIAGKLSYALNQQHIYLTGQVRQQQFYTSNLESSDSPDLDGMDERDPAFEIGVEFTLQQPWGRLTSEGLFDITNTHQGYELSIKYSYPKHSGKWLLEPSIGLQLQSSELVDFYHGVRISEVQTRRPAYTGRQAVNQSIGLTLGYRFDAHWLFIGGLEYLFLDKGITDSPIVAEDRVEKIYLGCIYMF